MRRGMYLLTFSVLFTALMFVISAGSMLALRQSYQEELNRYQFIKSKYIALSGIYIQASLIDSVTWSNPVDSVDYDLYDLDGNYLSTLHCESNYINSSNVYLITSYDKLKDWRVFSVQENALKQLQNFKDSYKPLD